MKMNQMNDQRKDLVQDREIKLREFVVVLNPEMKFVRSEENKVVEFEYTMRKKTRANFAHLGKISPSIFKFIHPDGNHRIIYDLMADETCHEFKPKEFKIKSKYHNCNCSFKYSIEETKESSPILLLEEKARFDAGLPIEFGTRKECQVLKQSVDLQYRFQKVRRVRPDKVEHFLELEIEGLGDGNHENNLNRIYQIISLIRDEFGQEFAFDLEVFKLGTFGISGFISK